MPLQTDATQLKTRAEQAQYVFYSFSGGRDSAAAMYYTLDSYRMQGKYIEAIYVDGGNELPSVTQHVHSVCDRLGVHLTVLRGPHFRDVYNTKLPDSIHMNCIEKLINAPMDKYMRNRTDGADYVLVRGGKATQKRPESRTNIYQTVKNKPQMIIYNPLFEYDAELPDWLIWSGYAQGFQRTACYCCPFQRPEQWQALKRVYPDLYAETKHMFETTPFVVHPGDGHIKYIANHWIAKEHTAVKLCYCASREKMLQGNG